MARKYTKEFKQEALVGALTIALCLGFLFSWPISAVPIAHAACGTFPGWCGGDDLTRTSVLTVDHVYNAGEYLVPVEPDDTDTVQITAYWATVYGGPEPFCYCQEVSAQVTADVTWSDASHAWSVSCTGCSVSGPIYSVGVCLAGSYCSGDVVVDNSAGYKLYVDMDQQNLYYCPTDSLMKPAHLNRVVYSTTSLDDGNLVNMVACTEGASVSPTTQMWSQIDYGPFECTNNCSQSGPSLAIYYD